MRESWRLSASAAAQAIRARELEPIALVEALLERAVKLDPTLRVWAHLASARARDEAAAMTREAARGEFRGVLHGVPVGIKDNFDTAHLPTTAGSQLLRDRVPMHDAAAVQRLRAAGAIVLGKTAMTVFAAMDPAPTRNPWQLDHTPGGSSSGSAAAVAARLAPAAIGSQTAGSILRPAAFCGVIGLKPTYGAIDRGGLYPCAWSMDHAGPITRTVEDAALLFGVMANRREPPIERDVNGVVVGVATDDYFRAGVDEDTQAAFDRTLARLADAGAVIKTIALPERFQAGVDAGIIAMYAEMAAIHADRFPAQRDRYGWKLACLLDAGRSIAASDYLRAQQVRRVAADELSAMLATIDCLATPTTPTPAPRGLDATGDWRFNLPFSSTGHPALTVPIGNAQNGLPIGLQLVARYHGEAMLFRVGAAIEDLHPMPALPFGISQLTR